MIYIIICLIFLFVFINQLINKNKRFQDSNKIEQIWRYRYYLLIPIKWIWYSIVGLKIYRDEWNGDKIIHTNKYDLCKGKQLWRLLTGIQQGPMKWYYTQEEVFGKLKKYKK